MFDRRTLLVLGAVLGAVLGIAPAWADVGHTPPVHLGAPVSSQGYGKQNPACAEWTDGCVLCVSHDGQSECSTPGIACTPAGLTCKRRTSP